MTWYSEFGFKENPLDVRPNPDLVGLEKHEKKLINHIKKEEICFLNGLTGTGKSSLLLRIQKQLKGHKFIYLDAQELPGNFNIEEELRKKRGFFDRLVLRNTPRKRPVLIIDEFQATSPEVVLQARAGWENPVKRKIKSIIVAQISRHLENVTSSFKERLGSRIVTVEPLDEDEMKEILEKRLKVPRKRVNLVDKLTDDALSFIVRCSGNNPRRMLEYVDELFEFHYHKFGENNPLHNPRYQISFYGAKEILGLDKVQVEGFIDTESLEVKKDSRKLLEIFSKTEVKILKFIDRNSSTITDIAEKFDISEGTVSKYISSLRKKKGIVFAGKKGRKKKWQISPSTKRLMVKV